MRKAKISANQNDKLSTIKEWLKMLLPPARWVLLVLMGFTPLLEPLSAAARTNEMELQLPILTVSQKDGTNWTGQLITLNLKVTRKSNNQSLLVAIAEDRPNGVGEQFRAALWSAASTVALERGDPLRGCTLELTVTEAIDGPSAGAMMTLGIMSALDGGALPDDFAFTGSILPNGSVGYVGGVVQKIEAAKAAGKKRVFVPAYYRAEKDLNSGELIDLKEKCRSLGMQMIPVASVQQAYALIHGLKEPPSPIPVLELPDKVENALVEFYRRESKEANAAFQGLTADEQGIVTNHALLRQMAVVRYQKADQAYRAGNVAAACDYISDISSLLKATKETLEYAKNQHLEDLSTSNFFSKINERDAELIKDQLNASGMFLETRSLSNSPVAAQFDDFIVESVGLVSLDSYCDDVASSLYKQALDSNVGEEQSRLRNRAQELKLLQLIFAGTVAKSQSMTKFDALASLVKGKPKKTTAKQKALEQLMFNSMEAAFNSFDANTIKPAAQQVGASEEQLVQFVAQSDLRFLATQNMQKMSEILRGNLHEEVPLYVLVSFSRQYARALSGITSLTIKDELEPVDGASGVVRYGNTALLQAFLQSAREEAVTEIGRCQKDEVQCWEPLLEVQVADTQRDDPDEDKLDVFQTYFQAALDAKILRLLCGSNQ